MGNSGSGVDDSSSVAMPDIASSDMERLVVGVIVLVADFGVTNAVVELMEARMMAAESFMVMVVVVVVVL